MRTPAREIASGRAAAAWRRACARATAWLRDLSAASSWAAAGDPLRLAEWTASCFGTRLTELTNETAQRDVPPVPAPRRRRAAPDASRPAGANAAPRAPVGWGSNDGARPPALPTGAIGRPRLAALAGDVSRALRGVSGRRRLALDLLQPPLDSEARKVAPDLLTARSASISNAALEKRVSARLDRSLARAFRRLLPQDEAPGTASPSGWQHRLSDPEPDLVLAAAGAPIAAAPAGMADVRTAAAPAQSRQPPIAASKADFLRWPPSAAGAESNPYPLGEPHARSWRRRISSPDPQLTLAPSGPPAIATERVSAGGPVRRQPTPAAEPTLPPHDRAAAMVPSASGAPAAIGPATALASAAADKQGEPRASGPDAASRPVSDRVRIDPLEFAEQLRLALIRDAHRIGIEV
jgi:hypothetical protein